MCKQENHQEQCLTPTWESRACTARRDAFQPSDNRGLATAREIGVHRQEEPHWASMKAGTDGQEQMTGWSQWAKGRWKAGSDGQRADDGQT